MSRLEKLSISGVRSFSHTDRVVVKINSPLTLIQGQNGAGKTTIIECLKYATTGEFPPGPKTGAMGAFIHDPKVAGEREVKAVICLKFTDVKGNIITIARRMQTVQKQTRLESRTVESTIKKEGQHGETASISSRCADIDREMVSLLGVSKAVLSNVIFCHQEDSSWPLSDGKVLKAKFDEIFAATRYIKALESIRKFRKDQDSDLRVLNSELGSLRERKEKRMEFEENKAQAQSRVEAASECIQQVDVKLQPINERLAELEEAAQEWHRMENEIELLKAQRTEKERQVHDLKSQIQVVKGSADDLKAMLADSKANLQREKRALEEHNKQRSGLDKELKERSDTRNRLARDHGRMEQEAAVHLENIKKRDDRIMQLAVRLNKPEFRQGPFDEEDSGQFLRFLKGEVEGLIREHRELKKSHGQQQDRQQQAIDSTNITLTRLEEAKRSKTKTKAENDQQLQQIGRELREVSGAEGKLNMAELELKQAEEALMTAEEDNTVEHDRQQIGLLEREKKAIDAEISSLTTEVSRSHLHTKTRAELDLLRKSKLSKEEAIRKIEHDHDDLLQKLFGGTLPDNLQDTFQQQLKQRRQDLRTVKQRGDELNRRLRAQQTDQDYQKKQLKQDKQKLKDLQARVAAVCPDGSVDACLEELEKQAVSLQDDLAVTGAAPKFFNLLRKLLEKNHSCPVCDRNFRRESAEMESVVKKLADKGAAMPQNQQKLKADLAATREEMKKLQDVRPVVETVTTLRQQTIPSTDKRIAALGEKIDDLSRQSMELTEEEALVDSEVQELIPLESDIKLLQSYREELRTCERRIAEKQGSMQGSSKPLPALTQELTQKQIESESKGRQLDMKRDRVTQHDNDINALKRAMQDARERKLEIAGQMQRCQKLKEQKASLASSSQSLVREIQEATRKLEPLQRKLEEQAEERKRQKDEHSAEEEKQLQEINAIRSKAQDIKETADRISHYLAQGKGDEVQRAQVQLDQISKQLAALEEDRTRVDREVTRLNKAVASHQVREREIADSINILVYQDEISGLDQHMQELKEKLGGASRRNVRREREQLTEQCKHLGEERMRHASSRISLQTEVRQFEKELQSDMFRDADERYRSHHIQVKTTELANSDLDRYYKALDKAIMRYHGMKMEEINRIIKDLWMKTYRGSDIDTIEIVSDVDEDGERKVTGRRSYNYRVVMKKGATSLDMRARCSAGQKVLACLIIRLALAETFCLTCGMLALDEPTTNLDCDNVQSLAQALVDIIEDRQRQRNFQLVIITHDEDFIEMLGRSDYTDSFYRVKKDDNQCSKVFRVNLLDNVASEEQ